MIFIFYHRRPLDCLIYKNFFTDFGCLDKILEKFPDFRHIFLTPLSAANTPI